MVQCTSAEVAIRVCPLCGRTACECDSRLCPVRLYDSRGTSCGEFVSLGLAFNCKRLLEAGHHTTRLIDRHGCPVKLPELS